MVGLGMAGTGRGPYNGPVITSWQGALDYLYDLANWETRPPGVSLTFELDRIRSVLAELGDPHTAWPAVHVAGTNGKGSVCAMTASALLHGGTRVGLFTSPHLHTVRERIVVDGRMISERAVIEWLNRNRSMLDAHDGLTTFEALTALAFSFFAANQVDVAVVEAGLGGRLDTTNVVEPAVCCLTSIGLDHVAVLGDTLELIARDKTGIIKQMVPVVSAPQDESVLVVLEEESARQRAPLTLIGRDITMRQGGLQGLDGDWRQNIVIVSGLPGSRRRYSAALRLLGRHQVVNAAVAVGALENVAQRVVATSMAALSVNAIESGLADAAWPGRFELLGKRPALVVDGAHNPSAMRVLRETLDELFPRSRMHLVFGASRDKAVVDMLGVLAERTATSVATASEHPRAMPAADVADGLAALGLAPRVEPCPAVALETALAEAGKSDVVLVTGSIYLVADAREAWADMGQMPMPPRDPPLEK
jgi:dihydrofolate synthase/folylpolyglutamate synthase